MLKPNSLQPLYQQPYVKASTVPSTVYLKTNEPLIVPTFKYPVSKYFCNRCDTPHSTPYELADFYENLGRQKTALQTSIYSHIDKQTHQDHSSTTPSNASLTLTSEKDKKSPNLQIHCQGLQTLKKLPDISTTPDSNKSIMKEARESKLEKKKISLEKSDILPNNYQTPLKLKYCTVKDLALKLPIQNKKLVWDFNQKTKPNIM